jgi:hypothetical protein
VRPAINPVFQRGLGRRRFAEHPPIDACSSSRTIPKRVTPHPRFVPRPCYGKAITSRFMGNLSFSRRGGLTGTIVGPSVFPDRCAPPASRPERQQPSCAGATRVGASRPPSPQIDPRALRALAVGEPMRARATMTSAPISSCPPTGKSRDERRRLRSLARQHSPDLRLRDGFCQAMGTASTSTRTIQQEGLQDRHVGPGFSRAVSARE